MEGRWKIKVNYPIYNLFSSFVVTLSYPMLILVYIIKKLCNNWKLLKKEQVYENFLFNRSGGQRGQRPTKCHRCYVTVL